MGSITQDLALAELERRADYELILRGRPSPASLDPPKKTSDGGSTGYYKIPEGSADLQDLIELKNMNFSIGNIFKACYRLGEKSGTATDYDLRKIIFFAEREIARRSPEK